MAKFLEFELKYKLYSKFCWVKYKNLSFSTFIFFSKFNGWRRRYIVEVRPFGNL